MSPEKSGTCKYTFYGMFKAHCKALLALVVTPLFIQSAQAELLVFPTEVDKFIKMTEIQQKEHERSVIGLRIRGSGKITNVEECGFLSQSKLYGRDCYEIVIDRGLPRAVLYVSKKERSRVISLKKGDEFTFTNCTIRGLKNFGLWSTVYCDLAIQGTPQADQNLIAKVKLLNDQCRGGSGDDPKTLEACESRDTLNIKLNQLGWCYGKKSDAGYQMKWHQCEINSNR